MLCPCENNVFDDESSSLPEIQSRWQGFYHVNHSAALCQRRRASLQLRVASLSVAKRAVVLQVKEPDTRLSAFRHHQISPAASPFLES